ncbi:MAG: hypothetical protein AAFW83_01695 [Pseudomonadota bacterium]
MIATKVGPHDVSGEFVEHEEHGVCFEETWRRDNKVDRDGGPAVTRRSLSTGELIFIRYMRNGKEFRRDGPSTIEIDTGSRIEWFKSDSVCGNEDGIFMRITDLETGMLIGISHVREDGLGHKTEGPAVWHRDPDTGVLIYEEYCLDGEQHRLDGAAYIERSKDTGITTLEEYRVHGQLHRSDGPALIERDPITGQITHTENHGYSPAQDLPKDDLTP